jgi:ABC-type lipoprotein release transport system permease subunit
MAWRNIWRNPRRSILTICAIVFACALLVFMLSLQFGSYYAMIDFSVRIHTGYLQVQAKGYDKERNIYQVVSQPERVGRILAAIPEVSAFTYRANAFSLVSSKQRTYGVLVIGIEPDRETRVSTLKSLVRKGDYLAPGDKAQALVGDLLARNLKADVGDEIVVLGQGRDGSVAATIVTIKGIFSSGQEDFYRSSINIPLDTFQQVYSMGDSVHEVVVMGHRIRDFAELKREIAGRVGQLADSRSLAVLDWRELMPGLIQGIKIDMMSGVIFYLFLVVVVAFSILNTFLMAILERTREFGAMMALGTTPGRLIRLLLMESMTMTGIGILCGILAGALLTWYFELHGIALPGAGDLLKKLGIPDRIYPRLSWWSIAIGPSIVFIITFFTALYPALKVRRLRPVEALAHV